MMTYLRRHHSGVCRQWFEELDAVELKGGLLRVQTATPIQQNYLQNKCRDQFNEAARSVTGHLVSVRFEHEHQLSDRRPDAHATRPPQPSRDAAVEARSSNRHKPGPNGTELPEEPGEEPADDTPHLKGVSTPPPVGRPGVSVSVTGDNLEEDQMILSPDYSFDNFITGPNNHLAYAAAVAVANQPGIAYNPLFIHGGVGLGKTHLLQAVCQKILTDQPETHILYVSCDAFMNQFIACVQSGQMNEFRHRYRYVDMLVIDDIHFLGSRERTQEEFFHTFNELFQQKKQIVLSSDAAPHEIPHLEDRLVSRFQWGLVAPVTQPHYETRVAILRAKSKLRGIDVPDDVLSLIASQIESNARELEGAITTLQAHAALTDATIDMALARRVLGEPAAQPRSNQYTLQRIIEIVTRFYGVKLSDLQSRRRHKSVTEPRQICMWLARRSTRFSLEEIGGYFGGRDHTTVMHSVKAVDERIATDPAVAEQVKSLDRQLTETQDES
ncbi:MAG: chromosomal replication initiator protein DnaA [Phycisphaeraceae bacterium]